MHEFFNGAIVAWSGYLSKIPRGWVLCDGQNGTPDLRDRFVYGATKQGDMRKTGGVTTHNHFIIDGLHIHGFQAGNFYSAGADISGAWSSNAIFSITENKTSEPDYYEVAYIMEWEGW